MRRLFPAYLALILLVTFAQRSGAQTLADKVPDDALVTIAWRGTDNLGPAWAQSNMKGAIDTLRIAAQLEAYMPMLFDELDQHNTLTANSARLLWNALPAVLRHPTALCFRGMAPAHDQTPPLPILYLVCQSGAQTDALYKQLNEFRAALPNKMPALLLEKSTDQVTLQIGGTVLVGTTKDDTHHLALASVPAFQAAMAQVQKDPVLWTYADTPGLLTLATTTINTCAPPDFRPRWPKMRTALGLNGLGPLAATADFDGKDWQSQAFMPLKGPRSGILLLADYAPLTDALLGRIPQGATSASAFHLNFAQLFQVLHATLHEAGPHADKAFDTAMRQAREKSGVDLEKSLSTALGDEWVAFRQEYHGTGLLESTLVIALRDAQTTTAALAELETFLQKLSAAATESLPPDQAFTLRHVNEGALDITVLNMPIQQICYLRHDNYLYVAPEPGMIARAVEHLANPDASILKNETFQAMRKRLNVREPRTLQYLDLPTLVPEMLTTFRDMLTVARTAGANVPADLLPTNEAMQPFLTPSLMETWTDQAGWHARSIGPFPAFGI